MSSVYSHNKSRNINGELIKCSLCGHEYNEQQAQKSCKGCLIMKGCKLIKCPNCGFEVPPSPKWLKQIK